MTRYADPTRCPDCSTDLFGSPLSCPSCRLPLRHPLTAELYSTLSRADQLLGQLRLSVTATPPMPAPPTVPRSSRRTGLRATSVPAILLGLGALCLLVASVIFLAVAWSWLGVSGRTAVLAGLTVTGAGLGFLLTSRGLRVAGEALSTVTFGLLILDLVGADRAGWLGERTASELGLLVGLSLLAAALAWSVAQRRLATPQLVAGLGLFTAYVATTALVGHPLLSSATSVVSFAALAAVARVLRQPLLPWVALAGAAPCWLTLSLTGLAHSLERPTLAALWSAGGPGWALLAATVLLLLPIAIVRLDGEVARLCLAAAASVGVATVCLPVVDEGLTAVTGTALTVLAAGVVAGVSAPRSWLAVPLLPAGLASMPVLVIWMTMLGEGVARVIDVGAPFTVPADVRMPSSEAIVHPVLVVPAALALLALAWIVVRALGWRMPLLPARALVVLSAVVTLVHYPVPLWSVVVVVLLGAAAAVGRDPALAAVLVGGAGGIGLASASLTVLTTAVLVLGSAATLRRAAPGVAAAAVAGLTLPAAIGGLLWSISHVVEVDQALRGVPIALVVGVLAVALHRKEVEVSAAVTVGLTSTVAVTAATSGGSNGAASLALHLTLLGALVSSSALLHRDRRRAGWVGGSLLAAATWVRLADLGVGTPEAYTLPSALALLAFGLHRLHRDSDAPTGRALTTGLLLATTPSLLWALVDPISSRATLLGGACLTLVVLGSRLRWNAPLVIGATVGGVLVLRELAPYAAQTPQWVVIGLAGTLLTVVGVTWERRLVDLKQAVAYLDRLR